MKNGEVFLPIIFCKTYTKNLINLKNLYSFYYSLTLRNSGLCHWTSL